MTKKICVTCNSITTYVVPKTHRIKWYKKGLDYICHKCYRKEFYRRCETIKNAVYRWRKNNPDKESKIKKRYANNHPEVIRNASSKYKTKNPDYVKRWNDFTNVRKIKFKNQSILLKENPRIGVCNYCRKSIGNGDIERTHMHHEQYDSENPLAHTIELCASCHALETKRVKTEEIIQKIKLEIGYGL